MSAVTPISLFKPMIDSSSVSSVGSNAFSGALPSGATSGAGQVDFGQMITDMVNQTTSSLQGAEAASIQGIKGEASAHDVATAVMDAEQSLRMAISVRDKMVQAYMEISRMQI